MSDEQEAPLASRGDVDWSVFLEKGVIVTLSIKRYRGTVTMDFSELGLDSTDSQLTSFLGEYIQPGQKRLIPPEIEGQLKSIEQMARQNLKERSFDCSAFASTGKFVPNSMYPEFKETNEKLMERFYNIRDSFALEYDEIVAQVRNDYRILAETLYMQSHPDAKKPSTRYVNKFVDGIVSQIPGPDEICAQFEYTTILTRIPDYLLKVISKKQDIDEKVMRIAATNAAAAESIVAAADDKKSKSKKASKTKSKDEEKQDKENNDIELDEEEKQDNYDMIDESSFQVFEKYDDDDDDDELDEIERDIRASMRTQSKGMADDFVSDIKTRLMTDASNGAKAIISSIDKNDGKLVGRASIKAHSLVETLSKMNFYGDIELESRVADLREAIGDDKKDRDVTAVRKAAYELEAWADHSLEEIHTEIVERKTHTPQPTIPTSAAASKAPTDTQQVKTQQKKKTSVKISVPRKPTRRRTIKERS